MYIFLLVILLLIFWWQHWGCNKSDKPHAEIISYPLFFYISIFFVKIIANISIGNTILVRELWIGNLPENLQDKKLSNTVEMFGEVENIEFYNKVVPLSIFKSLTKIFCSQIPALLSSSSGKSAKPPRPTKELKVSNCS